MADNQSKSRSPKAYAHYLQTGTIYGYYEGAVRKGSGRPPTAPLEPDEFDLVASKIPKPMAPATEHWSEPSDLARMNVARMVHDLRRKLTPVRKGRAKTYTPLPEEQETKLEKVSLRHLMNRLEGDPQ